jgi:eukaryotic-like serine/threonine-protein kinase
MTSVSPTRVIGGRYVVLGELGRGGMGVVWRAEDRVMGRQVAVKELHLPPGLPTQERLHFRERLLREARTAGRLNHPGIVTVFDVISENDVDHVVMELIDAQPLSDVVARSGPLDERTATSVAVQLLDALGAAHAGGVVHRDVKPANVMLGHGGRVKLTDFGIAQAADDPRLTTTGALVGSPGYMAPERLAGEPAAPAADLWALGATLFHALTGQGPFGRDSTAATISAVLHAEVPTVRTRGPLGSVVGGLLQRDPRARLGGAQAAALLAAEGPPPDGGGPRSGTRAFAGSPPPRRRRWLAWVGGGALLLVTLVAGVGLGTAATALADLRVTTLTYGEGGDVPDMEVSTTSCLTFPPRRGQPLGYEQVITCEAPHTAELFATWTTFDSSTTLDYPGEDALRDFAAAACEMAFDSDTVVGTDKGQMQLTALVPSRAAFLRDSNTTSSSSPSYYDRDVHCVLSTPGAVTGSRLAE